MSLRTSKVKLDGDVRERVWTLRGGVTATDALARASVQPLLTKLKKRAKSRLEEDAEMARYRTALHRASPVPKKVSAEEREAATRLRRAAERRAKRVTTRPPDVQVVPPMIRSGSIFTVDGVPYEKSETQGAQAVANHLRGTLSITCGNKDFGLAALVTFFRPPAGMFPARFAPLMRVTHDLFLSTYTSWYSRVVGRPSRAEVFGEIGAFVSVEVGQQFAEVVDVRETLWHRRVSFDDDVIESDDSFYSPDAEFTTFKQSRRFALIAFATVETTVRSGLGLSFAVAAASLSASVPFMVVEQKV